MGSALIQSAPANSDRLLSLREKMARRRHQNPKPFREGAWWWIFVRQDEFRDGKIQRVAKRIKLAPADKGTREAQKIADEYLKPMNHSLSAFGSATNFKSYILDTYIPNELPLLARPTVSRYNGTVATRKGECGGIIGKYLVPAFGELSLRDITLGVVQRYFSGMATSPLSRESVDKIKDVLSAILRSAVLNGVLDENPIEKVRLAPNRHGRRTLPVITFEQFNSLLDAIPEPYSTMVFVTLYSGVRISELIGLKWNDVRADSLMIDERCCRGDWSQPKSASSNAEVPVPPEVIKRIHALKNKVVVVRNGGQGAKKTIACVKSANPDDLVFQGLRKGGAMRDNNILSRWIKPAARQLGIGFVNWKCLRTSLGTWLLNHGATIKDVQAQLRHSRASTTMDIYVQHVPESQRRAVAALPIRRVM